MIMTEQSFLGVGWQFPVAVDSVTGEPNRIAVSAYEQLVEESILIILGTNRGERCMRPDFGGDLKRLVFSPNNTTTAGLAIYYVEHALQKWEPRIELLAVDANPDLVDTSLMVISIYYKVIATNNERNLVYPFYLGGE